jgi:hypothetical protein
MMNQFEQIAAKAEHKSREQDAINYRAFLDAGDFDAMGAILERAQTDPELEALIWDIEQQMIKEDNIEFSAEEVERAHKKVTHIIQQYFEEY